MAGWNSLGLAAKVKVSGRRAIVSDPLVAGDAIYAADTFAGDVIKLDRHDLRELWRTPSEKREPLAHYGRSVLMAGADTSGLDAATGKRLWTRAARFGGLEWNGRPVLENSNHTLDIVDADKGEVAATLEVPPGLPQILRGDVVVLSMEWIQDPVRAFSLRERRLLWERNLLQEIQGPGDKTPIGLREPTPRPVLHFAPGGPGRFILTCGRAMFGCSLEDGELLWQAAVAVPYKRPNVHEGRIYVLTGHRAIEGGRFVALDEASGITLYDVKHPKLYEAIRARPGTIYGQTIAFAHETGHLAVFDLSDGRLVWLYKHKAPLWGTAEADGRLLVSTGDGKLLVFENAA